MPALDSQIALVTGAARGVGEAVSLRLASLGAHVLLVARDTKRLNQVRDQIQKNQGQATVMPCDLSDTAAIARLAEQVARDHKHLDILVNNAAIGGTGQPLHEVRLEDWDRLIDTNLRAPYLLIRAFAPMMIAAKSGHIVNISSLAGHNPLPNNAVYAASKWGLNGLTYSVAEELRPHKVRVSVVAPGSINTHFDARHSSGKDPSKMIQPDDVASVVATIVTQTPQSFISEVLLRPTQKP
ncbi:MAG TPA: SDR family oxidoreductase [Acidobacteriaceae bacterium]|nr:SDR family oxidoreductase [Acidobacteriaceae bacterium]